MVQLLYCLLSLSLLFTASFLYVILRCLLVCNSSLLLSSPAGNEVHVVVNTDTEYEKKDTSNHFGLKCQIVGYEWTNGSKEVSLAAFGVCL